MSRHKLFAALVAAGCLAAATQSGAVEVNPDGIGQVLLYPYYTVRSSSAGNVLNTLFTIGNTTDHVKAVRLRFREGAVGVSVAEPNIYLGARDMWTAAVIPREDGGAELVTADRSCAVSPLYDGVTQARLALSNSAYAGDPLDGSVDRTREGFFEVIEMGDYGPASTAAPGSVAEGASFLGGVPRDCSRAQADTGVETQPGTGGLFGRAILINVGDGTEFSYSATALANFNTTRSLWTAADAPGPTLADANMPISIVHTADLGTIRTEWTQPIDAVSAVLMRESISNEFVVNAGLQAITDWVVTMPTKYYYVRSGLAPTGLFQSPLRPNGACDVAGAVLFDRESRTSYSPIIFDVPAPLQALCWASTVIGFSYLSQGQARTNTLFGSKNSSAITPYPWDPANATPSFVGTIFEDGWMRIALSGGGHFLVGGTTTLFKPDGSTETRPQATYYGLPVIGFAAESYTNGTLTVNGQPVLSNYGGLIGHRYTSNVQ